MMEENNEVIRTYSPVGWNVNTVDNYGTLTLYLRYQTLNHPSPDGTEVGQTLWLTADVARQFISMLEAGVAKTGSGDHQADEYRRHQT